MEEIILSFLKSDSLKYGINDAITLYFFRSWLRDDFAELDQGRFWITYPSEELPGIDHLPRDKMQFSIKRLLKKNALFLMPESLPRQYTIIDQGPIPLVGKTKFPKKDEYYIFEYYKKAGILPARMKYPLDVMDKIRKALEKRRRYTQDEIIQAIDNYANAIKARPETWRWQCWHFLARETASAYYPDQYIADNYKQTKTVSYERGIDEFIKKIISIGSYEKNLYEKLTAWEIKILEELPQGRLTILNSNPSYQQPVRAMIKEAMIKHLKG